MDESGNASVVDKSEPSLENEDESDQAKASFFFVHFSSHCSLCSWDIISVLQHYLESNEKYYLMAHRYRYFLYRGFTVISYLGCTIIDWPDLVTVFSGGQAGKFLVPFILLMKFVFLVFSINLFVKIELWAFWGLLFYNCLENEIHTP